MINVTKQIQYWISSSESDLESAELLIANKKFLNGLFFCHLAVEKAIKAHIVKVTKHIPPKSHNLIFLIEKTKLKINDDMGIFFGVLMKYQLEGRYPDYNPYIPSKKIVEEYIEKTKEIFEWIKKQL